ncbi:hypothetical protein [Aquimarina muelleri]|uniref:Uncharacterized protein n=1 Tax=Aquimarina muelleri TaxID=279356 RepID=A0A918JS44_9FLAO|nr:hypothetical protein [Aquimarina muelleri]MCX2762628.1 hypothetical protein [Aquimarina muelleri]GGX05946.1 hypothetical protein GCM10007384_04560 [Aquimarina muelleri]
MKLKFAINITFLLLCGISFGQNFENEFTSVKNIDNQILEEEYSTDKISTTDRLIVQTPSVKKDKSFYSKKEWKKIKKQLKKNKKRFSNIKNNIYSSKTIDTIYLNVPDHSTESRLSGW